MFETFSQGLDDPDSFALLAPSSHLFAGGSYEFWG